MRDEVRADALLASLEQEHRGKLKVFLGAAPGVGKTYAMLQAVREQAREGVDILIGVVETHGRQETLALLDKLAILPRTLHLHRQQRLEEMDLDGLLARKPAIAVVDELAHSNAPGSRHEKRWQDVEELLNAGIDVYTTLNVQHLESLNDVVASITGISVSERVPDNVFDSAYQVEVVDLEPADLLERLREGKIYRGPQAAQALDHFFSLKNLASLREIALRRTADQLESSPRFQGEVKPKAGEHILICLSGAPSNAKVIRTAARMAGAFRCGFTALFVETSKFQWMPQSDRERLRDNLKLAQKLGASIETVYGDDIAYQIAEYSRLSGITKIVLGRDMIPHRYIFRKASLTEQLIELAPDFDIHIIPDNRRSNRFTSRYREVLHTPSVSLIDLAKSILILALATIIGLLGAHSSTRLPGTRPCCASTLAMRFAFSCRSE